MFYRGLLPRAAATALGEDGSAHFTAAADEATLLAIDHAPDTLDATGPGVRLHSVPALAQHLAATGLLGRIAVHAIGPRAKPVRAILFDKSPDANWSLGWHQDRTIAVRARRETEGYGPWTIKAGMQHVQPPQALLDRMVTLRLHLDPAGADNAPLLVALGSHLLGRVAEADIPGVVQRCGVLACLADRGDVWVYSTPILHASEAAARPARRRVLQVDYSADDLPAGLEWLGI